MYEKYFAQEEHSCTFVIKIIILRIFPAECYVKVLYGFGFFVMQLFLTFLHS